MRACTPPFFCTETDGLETFRVGHDEIEFIDIAVWTTDGILGRISSSIKKSIGQILNESTSMLAM